MQETEKNLLLVNQEINRRLQGGRVKDVADGTLFRYQENLTKLYLKHKQEREEVESKGFNLLDQIHFLPRDRAIELLNEDIKTRDRELKAHRKELKRLMNEV